MINEVKFRKIVAHGGSAHRDDFLSIACLLGAMGRDSFGVSVERREPSEAELADPTVCVLDVGGKHDPDSGNFDHHQMGRDISECALSLLNSHFGWGLELFSWFKTTVTMDHKGPMVAAKELGLEKFPFELSSPVEAVMVQWLSECIGLVPEHLHRIMGWLGSEMLAKARHLKDDMEVVSKAINGQRTLVTLKGEILDQVTDLEAALNKVREGMPTAAQFSAAIIPRKNRDSGTFIGELSAYRYDDSPEWDMSRIAGHELCAFAHKGGFIAVSIPDADPIDWVNRVKELCYIG